MAQSEQGRLLSRAARGRSLLRSTRAVVLLAVTSTCALAFATSPAAAPTYQKFKTTSMLGRAPVMRPACSGPPAAPILNITNVSRAGADLSWSPAEGARDYGYSLAFLTPSGWTPYTDWTYVQSPITVRVQHPGATAFLYALSARSGGCGSTYAQGSCVTSNPGPCNRVELRGKPSAPTGVSAVYSEGLIAVSWKPSADDGGSPVTYQVTASPGGAACSSTSTSCQVSSTPSPWTSSLSVPPGTAVTFTVVATNVAGSSDPSLPSNPITILGAPSPPTDVKVASTTINSATVAWNSSQSGGGTTVTRYVATARPGGKTCQSASLSCRISGLKPGATYRFEVVADNGTLTSEPASSEKVRLPRPAAPRPVPKPKPSQSLS